MSTTIIGNIASFLTTWNLVLLLAWRVSCKVFNMPLMTLCVSVMGAFLAYVYPRRFCIKRKPREICVTSPWAVALADTITHQLPLLMVGYATLRWPDIWLPPSFWGVQTFNTVCLLGLYVAVFDPAKLYNINANTRCIDSSHTTTSSPGHLKPRKRCLFPETSGLPEREKRPSQPLTYCGL